VRYLARFNKTLPGPLLEATLAHPLAGNPLFLRTLAEELRLFGVHEQLARGVAHYLASQTLHDLFERVLQRVESDCGRQAVKTALVALWASRAGLREKELLDMARLQPAQWAAIRNALDEALLETGGRLIFAHDYMRQAVMQRYLADTSRQRQAHRALARWFASQPADARRAEEEPFQWRQAGEWTRLQRFVRPCPGTRCWPIGWTWPSTGACRSKTATAAPGRVGVAARRCRSAWGPARPFKPSCPPPAAGDLSRSSWRASA
jgi:hypothetical protein